jgi:predicted anti-sigma-YlaC factor YlaD
LGAKAVNCKAARPLLSAYYDGELPSEERAMVANHVVDCPICSAELASYQWLSRLAMRLPEPAEAPLPWTGLPEEAAGEIAPRGTRTTADRATFGWERWAAVAATVMVALGALWGASGLVHSESHGHQSDLSEFLSAMGSDPKSAQHTLLSRYSGRPVSLDEASRVLGYRPAAAAGLPGGWEVTEAFLLDMPCCTCAQVICTNLVGRSVAVFEHEAERAIEFRGKPETECLCHGKPTRLVESDAALAATWKNGERYVTLVGAQNVDEVNAFVAQLSAQAMLN